MLLQKGASRKAVTEEKAFYTREVPKGIKIITVYLGKTEKTVYFSTKIFVSRARLL